MPETAKKAKEQYVIRINVGLFLDDKALDEVSRILNNISFGMRRLGKLQSGTIFDSLGNEVGMVYAPDVVLVSLRDVEWLERLSGKEIERRSFFE